MIKHIWDPWAEFEEFTLPNGLTVYHSFWDRPWLSTGVLVYAGAREDPPGKSGMAHYVEHLVSQNIPDWEFKEAQDFFRQAGASASFGATSYLGSFYSFFIPLEPATVRRSLEIFGAMTLRAKLDRELEREKRIIQQEFSHAYASRAFLDWDRAPNRALFKGHRLETYNRPLGLPEEFLDIRPDETRNFYERYYTPKNMAVIAVGGLKRKELEKYLLASPFAKHKKGERNPITAPFDPLPEVLVNREEIQMSKVISAPSDSTNLSIGWTLPHTLPPEVLRLCRSALHQLLDDEIRQRLGTAYSYGAGFLDHQDIYHFIVGGKIEPGKAAEVEAATWKLIEELGTREDLFEFYRASSLHSLKLTDISGDELVESLIYDLKNDEKITTLTEAIANLEAVTFDKFKEVVSYLTPARSFTLIIRP